MKYSLLVRYITCTVALLFLTDWSSGAHAQTVGRTPGTYAVSPTGAATYTIPIFAPKGPAGMQPNIALVYNSQSGNGYVGVGWNIAGLSAITRCNLTYAQDGAPAAVSLSASDGFCLDGNRLRATTGYTPYCSGGTTYATEIANFSNVSACGSAGNGPAYFVVQTADGHTLQYGNTSGNASNSQVLASGTSTALSWMLDEESDPAGNTMTIAYCPTSATQGTNCPSAGLQGTTVPSTISWTPTSRPSSSYVYTMTFNYGANVAPPAGYVAGTLVENPYLLGSITISCNDAALNCSQQVKEYVLSYQQQSQVTGSGRDVLTQVQECGTSASQSDCLYATQITYQGGSAGVATSATTVISNPLSGTWGSFIAHYDFNGDGYTDLVYQVGTTWYVQFGSASGYGTAVNTGISGALGVSVLFGDLLGTGHAGILANHSGTWYYYTWNGSSFGSGTSTGLAYDSNGITFALADVNGDGLPDLVELVGPTANEALTTRLNQSSGGTPSFASSVASTSVYPYQVAVLTPDLQQGNLPYFDFNGDGRQDLTVQFSYCASSYEGQCLAYATVLEALISQSNGTFATQLITSSSTDAPFPNVMFANVNNDACTDTILGNGQTVVISACNGNSATSFQTTYPVVAVMDWNGDGLADLIEENNGLYVQLSTATGFGAATPIPSVGNAWCTYVAFDANADGLDDLGCMSTAADEAGFVYYLHNGAGQPPDIMTSITDGYGNYVKPAYASIVQAVNSYYFPTSDAQYPYEDYLQPLYIVTGSTYSDPSNSGGTYLISDFYAGAWMNLQGRGFAGFQAHQLDDTRNNVWTTSNYWRAFPYTGMLSAAYATVGNTWSQTIFLATDTTSVMTLSGSNCSSGVPDPTQRCFPYISSDSRNDYEVSGPKAWQLITTTADSYGYDIYGNAKNISRTLTDEDGGQDSPPASPYYGKSWTTTITNTPDPDVALWCVNLLSQTQITYSTTLSGSYSAPALTKTFTPNTTPGKNGLCQNTQIVTASRDYSTTESLGYDAFGNVNSDGITGTNVAQCPCTTTINWGTTGQLPATVTDATGEPTNFGYDWRFGLLGSIQDANQAAAKVMTAWSYDEFGRQTQENRPDGTYTVWSYNNCVNWGGCLLGNNTLAKSHSIYAYGGALINDGTTWFDMLERPIVANQMLLDGSYVTRGRSYDNLGRVAGQSAPCVPSNSITDPCPYWTRNIYDVLNRAIEVQRPVNQTGPTGETGCTQIPPINGCQGTSYSYQGRTTVVTDANNESRTLVTDVNGWLRQTTDAVGYVVTLGYDSAGNKTSATDSEVNTLWSGSYGYGPSAYLTSETDIDRGTWLYTVDALGERTGWTDAKGRSFSETYDTLSRPLTRSEPDYFTQWSWGSTPSQYNVGKLASVCTGEPPTPPGSKPPDGCTADAYTVPGYSETETYDTFSRPSTRTITLPEAGNYTPYTYTWAYDSNSGSLSSVTYPTSTNGCQVVVDYGYTNGILTSLTDGSKSNCGSNGTVYWKATGQNPDGQITNETLGNGIVTTRTYDAVTHWLGSLQAGPVGQGAAVKNLSFYFDDVGNVTQRQDNNLGLTENISYDKDYRLQTTELLLNNVVQPPNPSLSISYDLTGNITSRSDVASGATWTYSPTHIHQVTQAGNNSYAYAYDANGNMTTRQGQTIDWSSYNYPTSASAGSGSQAESVSLYYGPDRQRWYQYYTGNGTTEGTYYLGKAFEVVNSSSSGTSYRNYIYAGNEPVAVYSIASSGNSVDYVLSDHQGSVATLTNRSGGTDVSESYTPFGLRRDPTTWSTTWTINETANLTTSAAITRQGYTFQTQLGLWMGMNHMNGRVEDSIIGRFLSADPNIPDPADPQQYNRYSYTGNNPLTYTDPTGFDNCAAPGGCVTVTAPPASPCGAPGGCVTETAPACGHQVNLFGACAAPLACVYDLASCFGFYLGGPVASPSGPSTQPGGGSGPTTTPANKPSTPTQPMQDCIGAALGSTGGSSSSNPVQGAQVASTALAGTTAALGTASPLSVGQAFGNFPLPGALMTPTSADYAAFGTKVQGALGSMSPWLKSTGIGLGFISTGAAAFNGYQTGGVAGAATAAGYGAVDMYVDYALTDLGPLGAVGAIAYNLNGGSQGLVQEAAVEGAIESCNAEAGAPGVVWDHENR